MAKYTSGRQKNLKVGLSSYSENLTSLEVIGKVGIGTTNATSSLYVVGNEYVSGVITATTFYGTFVGSNLDAYDTGNIENLNTTTATIDYITNTNLNTSGIGTIETLDTTRGVIDYLTSTNLTGVAGTITNLNVTGIATLGVTTTTKLSAQNIGVSGVVTATSFYGSLSGTATSTTNIPNLSGDVTSNNTVTTLATVNSNVGTFGSDVSIPTITVNAKGLVTAASANSISVGDGLLTLGVSGIGISGSATFTANQPEPATFTVTSNATSTNVNSTIVARDASGNFSAGIITSTQFSTGTSGIGINTNTISGPATLIIDPAGVGDNTGKVVIKGDFQVDGTQTIINSTTVTVDDKNIQIADGAINDMAADGAGITINSGEGNKTFQFSVSDNEFVSNISLGVANGKGFNINGSQILSSTTLASSVVNSSLTSVGTLGQLKVSGVSTVGVLTATSIGIGTTNPTVSLWVGGSGYFIGSVSSNDGFYLNGSLIGSGSISGSDIVGTALSIAGIGTIGQVKISSGIVTASTGIVTYYGDGSNLTSLNATQLTSGTVPSGRLTGGYDINSATASKLQIARSIGGVSFDGSAPINLPGVNEIGNQDTSGNAATASALETARTIGGVSFNGTTSINLPGVNQAGNQNTSGNAATASALETARTIGGVSFDGTANINLPGVNQSGNQSTSGNAATASKLQTARAIQLSGDVTGTVNFDGSVDATINTTIAANSVALGGDTTGNYVASITNGSYISGGDGGSESAGITLSVDATSANTASKIVVRDASGNFSAGTISANLTGTVSNISNHTTDALSEGSTNLYYSDSRSRGAVSAIDAGGDGSFGYDSTTGAFTYTGPSPTEVRAHFSGGTGVTITNGSVAIGQAVNTNSNVQFNNITIDGNLTVNGTTSTINSTTITVDDKNIELGSVASPSDLTADGGGITLKGATDKTFNWIDLTDSWTSSENIDLATGKYYKINGSNVLSSTTLGSSVLGSSLTSVGVINTGIWNGTVINSTYGGTGVNNGGRSITLNTGNIILTAQPAGSSVTVPSSGTLATLAGTEEFTNKTISAGTNSISGLSNSNLSGSAGITNANLANSTISGVSLGTNLYTLTRGSYLTGNDYNGSSTTTWAVDATSANTASKIVARDASGDFSAGTITATQFSGGGSNLTSLNASQLTSGTIPNERFPAILPAASGINLTDLPPATIGVQVETTDATCFPMFALTNSGSVDPKVNDAFTFNATTAELSAMAFKGKGVATNASGNTVRFTISSTQPSNPTIGDIWIDIS